MRKINRQNYFSHFSPGNYLGWESMEKVINGIIQDLEKQKSATERALTALRELQGFGFEPPKLHNFSAKKVSAPKTSKAIHKTKKGVMSDTGRKSVAASTYYRNVLKKNGGSNNAEVKAARRAMEVAKAAHAASKK